MRYAVSILVLLAGGAAAAQPARPIPAQAPAAVAAPATNPAAPAASEPQRTTATFADWTLRCLRPENAPQSCEVTQTVFDKAQPVAQTALGRSPEGLKLTILVPPSVTFAAAARLVGAASDPAIDLAWRRCLPAGCIADATLTDEQVRRWRARSEAGRIVFQDGAGREAAIPFVPRGLGQALDAMAKDDIR